MGDSFHPSLFGFGTAERPRFPYLTVGLYLGTIALAREHDIKTLFVLTEPKLARHLARLGVVVRQIEMSIGLQLWVLGQGQNALLERAGSA